MNFTKGTVETITWKKSRQFFQGDTIVTAPGDTNPSDATVDVSERSCIKRIVLTIEHDKLEEMSYIQQQHLLVSTKQACLLGDTSAVCAVQPVRGCSTSRGLLLLAWRRSLRGFCMRNLCTLAIKEAKNYGI